MAGITRTEEILNSFCKRMFLDYWTFQNPFYEAGHELCDTLIIFDDIVILFFDRETDHLRKDGDPLTQWKRWKRKTVDAQIESSHRHRKHIQRGHPIYTDDKCQNPIPFDLPENPEIHVIIVAHGAREACIKHHAGGSGSLMISYQPSVGMASDQPFIIELPNDEIVHVLDSTSLEIVFSEFSTITDFVDYLREKELTIRRVPYLNYAGEEEILAKYLMGFNEKLKKYEIFKSSELRKFSSLSVLEGFYQELSVRPENISRHIENQNSQAWDNLIKKFIHHHMDGTLVEDKNRSFNDSPILPMVRERRLDRRMMSKNISEAIELFITELRPGITRHIRANFASNFNLPYLFLQVAKVEENGKLTQPEQEELSAALQIALFAFLDKHSEYKTAVGIVTPARKIYGESYETIIQMNLEDLDEEFKQLLREENKIWQFWNTGTATFSSSGENEFPTLDQPRQKNSKHDPCYCGSGRKYMKCCRPRDQRLLGQQKILNSKSHR